MKLIELLPPRARRVLYTLCHEIRRAPPPTTIMATRLQAQERPVCSFLKDYLIVPYVIVTKIKKQVKLIFIVSFFHAINSLSLISFEWEASPFIYVFYIGLVGPFFGGGYYNASFEITRCLLISGPAEDWHRKQIILV